MSEEIRVLLGTAEQTFQIGLGTDKTIVTSSATQIDFDKLITINSTPVLTSVPDITGTESQTFTINSVASTPVKIKNGNGELQARNNADSGYADFRCNNLAVEGTETIIHRTDLFVDDNKIVLNANITATPTLDAGVQVERGISTNASLLWDESNDKWKAGLLGSEVEISLVGHGHTSGDISDFNEAAQDAVGGIVSNTNSIDLTYTDSGTPSIKADLNLDGTTLTVGAGGVKVTDNTFTLVSQEYNLRRSISMGAMI